MIYVDLPMDQGAIHHLDGNLAGINLRLMTLTLMGALMAARASPSPRPPLNPQFSPGWSPEALPGMETRVTPAHHA